jgi:hypothetical protein
MNLEKQIKNDPTIWNGGSRSEFHACATLHARYARVVELRNVWKLT